MHWRPTSVGRPAVPVDHPRPARRTRMCPRAPCVRTHPMLITAPPGSHASARATCTNNLSPTGGGGACRQSNPMLRGIAEGGRTGAWAVQPSHTGLSLVHFFHTAAPVRTAAGGRSKCIGRVHTNHRHPARAAHACGALASALLWPRLVRWSRQPFDVR